MRNAYDVIVVGGGPAGVSASIAAARRDVSVLLLEKANCVGGMLTSGLVGMIRTAGDRGGIVWEFWERLEREGCAEIGKTHTWVNPFGARVVLLDMLEEAGVNLLLHTHLAGVCTCDSAVTGIQIANKDGLQTLHCDVAVDATGDGDVSALAGAPFEKGRAGDGYLQAVSLNFVLAGIEEDLLPKPDLFHTACREALATGRIELAPPAKSLRFGQSRLGFPKGVRHFQYDLATHVDGSDATSLTEGECLCHRRVFAIWTFLRTTFEAYKKSILIDVASHLGVRETRRICGENTLTEEMVMGAVKHPDGVSRCSWYMDLHDGQVKNPLEQYRAARRPPDGDYYEIPYGCLVPIGVEKLLVSGRCISSTRPANGSLRLQPTCMNTGQAAGTAAALCVGRSTRPRLLDGADLRAHLVKQGMEL
jgi:hypothetical protein